MDTPPLLVGMSCEESARHLVYPALRRSDRLLLAARVVIDGASRFFFLIDRDRVLCMISGTHFTPRDYPDLELEESPRGGLLLVTAARHGLLTPDVAAVIGPRCTRADIAEALTSDVGRVREAVMLVLPQLLQSQGAADGSAGE